MQTLPSPTRWEKEIAAFERADSRVRRRPGGIVFVGSSTFRLWKTLESEFSRFGVINRGFGGSVISDSTYFLPRIIAPYAPRAVLLFAGTNDISSKRTSRQVASDFADFVNAMRESLPNTRIGFLEITSSPSRWAQRETVGEANEIIRRLCARNGVDFVEARAKFLDSKTGEPRPELYISDRLHPNADGYKLLADAVRPWVEKV